MGDNRSMQRSRRVGSGLCGRDEHGAGVQQRRYRLLGMEPIAVR